MSGRIRSIKPEILEDAKTASLDSDAWRLFVSLFLVADDHGNFRATPTLIEGLVFHSRAPRESVTELLARLSNVGLILLYETNGQKYGAIANWKKHQKVDRPSSPRVPGPYDAGSVISRDPRETLALPSRLIPISDPDPDPDQEQEPIASEAESARAERSEGLKPIDTETRARPTRFMEPMVLLEWTALRKEFGRPGPENYDEAHHKAAGKLYASYPNGWKAVLRKFAADDFYGNVGFALTWLAKNAAQVDGRQDVEAKPKAKPGEMRSTVPGAAATKARLSDLEQNAPASQEEALKAVKAVMAKLGG